MIVERDNDVITITLNAPWEREVMDYLWSQYGPDFLKNKIMKLLDSKERGRQFIRIQEEIKNGDAGRKG